MACFHPLKAFDLGINDNGKKRLKITSYSVDHVYKIANGNYCFSTIPNRSDLAVQVFRDFIEIPCGQCVGCRLDYSRQWANRCMLELQYHDSAYFVTLTYDDKHIPVNYYGDDVTGEAHESYTLSKRDVQLFMKRLRKRFSDCDIRFFLSGEYGSNTFRPHYHAIIFGLKLDDLVPYKKSELGFTYFNSDSLQKCWSIYDPDTCTFDPIGFAVVANVTWETCAYTARYVMKKLKGEEAAFYDKFNILPEFTLMSRKPGIGRKYFDDHPDLYQYDRIHLPSRDRGVSFRPPKYYDYLYDIEHPEEMAAIKEKRRYFAQELSKAKLASTNLDYLDYLSVEENSLSNKIKKLERRLD